MGHVMHVFCSVMTNIRQGGAAQLHSRCARLVQKPGTQRWFGYTGGHPASILCPPVFGALPTAGDDRRHEADAFLRSARGLGRRAYPRDARTPTRGALAHAPTRSQGRTHADPERVGEGSKPFVADVCRSCQPARTTLL